jgi:hypothetical protein
MAALSGSSSTRRGAWQCAESTRRSASDRLSRVGRITDIEPTEKRNISDLFRVKMDELSTEIQYPTLWSQWQCTRVDLTASVILLATVVARIDQPRAALGLATCQPRMTDHEAPLIRSYQPAPRDHWIYYASIQSTRGAAFGAIYHKWSVEIT